MPRGAPLLAALLAAGACSLREPAPPAAPALAMPAPRRGRLDEAVALNARCEGCHAEQAAEWRASLHQRADIEPAYRRSFATEPLPFCRGCHAPEADPERPEGEAVAALGVGCVTCHVTDPGAVLAAPLPAGAVGRPAPHPVARDARFAGPEACAGCHQFAFPGLEGRGVEALMQSTLDEHRASGDAATPCAGCHMPGAPGGRRDHRFAASRDEAFLRAALRAEARRLGPGRALISLAAVRPGHAFPTGDLFRRLEVRLARVAPDGSAQGQVVRRLARHFPEGGGRRQLRDDRLREAPIEVELEAGGGELRWWVVYQRVGHPGGGGEAEAVEGEIVLASGALPP